MSIADPSQSCLSVDPLPHRNRQWGIITMILVLHSLLRRFIGCLLPTILATVLLVAGCAHKDNSQLLADAKASQAKGDHRTAVVQIKNILQQQPDNGEARYLLGVSSLALGDLQ